MENLNKFELHELTSKEQKEIQGGGEWYPGGCSNGGGCQWNGPWSPGDGVRTTQLTNQMMELEFPIYQWP